MSCYNNDCYESNPCLDTPCLNDNCGCLNPTTFKCISDPGNWSNIGVNNTMSGYEVLEALNSFIGVEQHDKYVSISSTDTSSGYLVDKLIGDSIIRVTKTNSGAQETAQLSIDMDQLLSAISVVDTNFTNTNLTATTSRVHTFGNNNLTISGGLITFKGNNAGQSGVSLESGNTDPLYLRIYGDRLVYKQANSSGLLILNHNVLTGTQFQLFPNSSGTLAMSVNNVLADTTGNITLDLAASITAVNGLTKTGSVIKLGGALTESTTLTGAQALAIPSGRLIIGGVDSPSSANTKLFISDTSNNQFSMIISKESNTYTGGVTPFLSSIGLNGSGTLGLGTSFSSNSSQLVFYNASPLNLYSDINTEYTATTSIIKFIDDAHNVTGNILSSYHSGMAVAGAANISAYAGIKVAPVQQVASTTGNIQDGYTGTITDYYGIHINDLRSSSLQSRITNSYGIYQIGAADKNYFAGSIGIKTAPSSGLSLNVYGSSIYQANNTISTSGIGTSTAWTIGQLDGGAVAQSGSAISAAEINTLYLNATGNNVLNFLSPIGANVSNIVKNGTGNYSGATLASYTSIATLRGEGNIAKLAGLHVIPPRQEQLLPLTAYTGNIALFAGIYLEDASNSDIASSMTSKYGIYQVGSNDSNLFNGPITATNKVSVNTNYSTAMLSVQNTSTTNIAGAYISNSQAYNNTIDLVGSLNELVVTGTATTRSSALATAATFSTLYLKQSGDQTISSSQNAGVVAASVLSVSGGGNVTTPMISSLCTTLQLTDNGNYSNVSGVYISNPGSQVYQGRPLFTGNIATYYGLFLAASDSSSQITSRITNKRGIYQEGANDINHFGAKTNFSTSYLAPTSQVDIAGNGYTQLRLRNSATPTSTSDSNGNIGDIAWGDNYFYVKTTAGWKRSALTTF